DFWKENEEEIDPIYQHFHNFKVDIDQMPDFTFKVISKAFHTESNLSKIWKLLNIPQKNETEYNELYHYIHKAIGTIHYLGDPELVQLIRDTDQKIKKHEFSESDLENFKNQLKERLKHCHENTNTLINFFYDHYLKPHLNIIFRDENLQNLDLEKTTQAILKILEFSETADISLKDTLRTDFQDLISTLERKDDLILKKEIILTYLQKFFPRQELIKQGILRSLRSAITSQSFIHKIAAESEGVVC
nr:hypothetical protein [Candidatus Gracilibacteria bacterium]